jgi:hypothetical protein
MKWINSFEKFKESLQIDLFYNQIDLMESLSIWHDVLLKSVSADEVDLQRTLNLSVDFENISDINYLSDNVEFINSLTSIGLKKSAIQNTEDFQTFINKPCKFIFLYDFNTTSELEKPEYIIFQYWNETIKEWTPLKLYKVNDDIKKFYDKLTSKTIEIVENDDNFIYLTSNGNDWELQNSDKENDTYKKYLTKEELQNILDNRKVKLNII